MRRPQKESASADEARLEELKQSLPRLQASLAELREAKKPLEHTVQQVKEGGTRFDRALALETRLALLENSQVREVEWTISEYSTLLESCPKGQCILSPFFAAGGIPNMQLIFHPNGNKDARDGFCSIALRIPEGFSVSRVLYVSHDSFGPNIVKQAVEGFSNASRVLPPSAAVRGTAADVLLVGVREIYQHGWAANPMLEKVLLIGAPAAEINFQLLREQREREAESERRERFEKEARRQEELRQEADAERRAAQEKAEALQQVVDAMPAPVDAQEVMMQGAVRAAQARAQEAAREESPEEKAEREKKEQALAWLLEYQRKQAEEKEEAERQRLEREQAEREVKAQALERQAVEQRAAELRQQRRREEEARRREAEEERRLEEELRQAEEEATQMEQQRLRAAEERRRQLEEENRRLDAARREEEEQRRRDAERQRTRQEELRRLEEQRRAFERAEEERLKAEARREEEARQARQREEALQESVIETPSAQERRDEEVAIGSGFSATRALRRNREESGEGYGPRQQGASARARLFEPDSDEEPEEIFSMAKFQPARANMGPGCGSNLRAWALAAAKEASEDNDEELDWMEQRRKMRAGAAPAPASLPSMQAGRRGSRDDDSGSDVEPVFFR